MEQELNFLKKNYASQDTAEIAKELNRPLSGVYAKAKKIGISKTKAYKRAIIDRYLIGNPAGFKYRFKKGHVPANLGKEMSPEQYVKSAPTMFRKGHMPVNHKPVGTISTRCNRKRGRNYKYVKLAEPNKWQELHRYLWKEHNGPIPEGSNIVFKDGNSENCMLENLEMIPNEELMRRNTIHNRYPEAVRNAIFLLGQTKRRIKEYERHQSA